MFGDLIKAGTSLIGGLLGQSAAKDANTRAEYQADLNRRMQYEFAQNGIRWKVEDAKQAGIHPLYALGANTVSYSPVSVGSGNPDMSMANAVSAMGQDVSRAVNATRTAPERVDAFNKTIQDLTVTNMQLKNEQLRSQIAKLNQGGGTPPFPSPLPDIPEGKAEDRPPLQVGGARWGTDPKTSNMEDFEKRYGDDGPASWTLPWVIGWQDLKQNVSGMNFIDLLRAADRLTQIDWMGGLTRTKTLDQISGRR